MSNQLKYACPECGGLEFVTPPNSHDKYKAIGNRLCWQKTELSGYNDFHLYCRA